MYRSGLASAGARSAGADPVRAVPEAPRHRALARNLVHQPSQRHPDDPRCCAGHGIARVRRRDTLDADRLTYRHPLCLAAAVDAGQSRDRLRAGRDLPARRRDRARACNTHSGTGSGGSRMPAIATSSTPRRPRPVADPSQWAYHLVLPWITFARPVRGDLRADDPRQRDGHARRGLRPHGARQGRARAAGDAQPRAPQRAAAGRDDARHGHRDRARRRHLHRVRSSACRASAGSPSRRSRASTCR